MKKNNRVLVADIGGTHLRLGIAVHHASQDSITLQHSHRQQCQDISCLASHIQDYLNSQDDVDSACIAVAGPVVNDAINMTNLPWTVSRQDLLNKLSVDKVALINDFAALAASLPYLSADDLTTLQGGKQNRAPMAVLGPGTGFGVAGLVPTQQGWQVLPGEGGHARLAGVSTTERQLIALLSEELEHISIETLLSGTGMSNLYDAYCRLQGMPAQQLQPSDISQMALADESSLARTVLNIFCAWLGSAAGDIALTLGANGGIFLGGGVLPRFENILLQSEFLTRFKQKGVMSQYVQNTPVHLIKSDHAALIGCAAHMLSK